MQSHLSMIIPLVWRYGRMVCACLIVLGMTSVAAAQQPTATIVQMKGEVLASFGDGSTAPGSIGLALVQGDAVQTKAGALAVLELSDGSQLELGENTNLLMEQLAIEPYSKARVSRVKLWWGKMRAVLSPGHQEEGASFDVQTPNSLVGVKFSKPDIEVQFDLADNTTHVFAYTVDVVVLNLVSGATQVIAAGSGAVITGSSIQVLPQIPQGTSSPQTPQVPPSQPAVPPSSGSGGLFSGNVGTIVAVGLGAGAVAGGVIAVNAALEDQSSDNNDFSGTFQFSEVIEQGVDRTAVLQLSQNDTTISGTLTETFVVMGCCTAVGSGNVDGTAQGNIATLSVQQGAAHCSCASASLNLNEKFVTTQATLEQNDSVLNFDGQAYIRQ